MSAQATATYPVSEGVGPSPSSKIRYCCTPGCGRAYLRTKHRHCCSMCRRGLHSPKCTSFQLALRQMSRTKCSVTSCTHLVNFGYETCCATCVTTLGVQHSQGCHDRQELLRTLSSDSSATATTARSRHNTQGFRASRTLTSPASEAPEAVADPVCGVSECSNTASSEQSPGSEGRPVYTAKESSFCTVLDLHTMD